MARQIVTQQAVTEAAEALITEGSEPSIMAVQSRIGGGSYTTVKRCLDVWRQERSKAAAAASDTPAEVQAKGLELARAVWALASREAQREAQQAKDGAHAEVAAVRGELVEASTELARLEGVEAEQAATIARHQVSLREAELALAEAQTQARRVPELEGTLAALRSELATVKAKAEAQADMHQAQRKTAAQEAARLAERFNAACTERDQAQKSAAESREEAAAQRGKLDALREQNAKLMEALKNHRR